MIWSSASEFWAMGGYGVYVWGSMGVSAALLALEVLMTRMGHSQALDAVCEAMDADTDEVLDDQAHLHASLGPARIHPLSSGASS